MMWAKLELTLRRAAREIVPRCKKSENFANFHIQKCYISCCNINFLLLFPVVGTRGDGR